VHQETPGLPERHATVCIGAECCDVEVAITVAEQSYGLMERTTLDERSGMLFVFDTDSVYRFWMKNTFIALDILWIDSNNTIVYIEHEAEPCGLTCPTIDPKARARYVLEINSGLSGALGIDIGDQVTIDIKPTSDSSIK
jgi:uncharacterized membrane protein (UPF0127 family)